MKLINQSFEVWTQPNPIIKMDKSLVQIHQELIDAIYAQIERAARICYKSKDKITPDSAKAFVERLISSQHYAMLEHGTVYLTLPLEKNSQKQSEYNRMVINKYMKNPYSRVYYRMDPRFSTVYITTNYRVIVENGWENDLEFLSSPTYEHPKRATVHFITSRQIAMEILRQRVMSFAMESTRYCNYNKGKFGSELTCIIPEWTELKPGHYTWEESEDWNQIQNADRYMLKQLLTAEYSYFHILEKGWKPQQAAVVLPNDLKADLIVTGFVNDWAHVFALRVDGVTGAPHPMMKTLMAPVKEYFETNNIV